MQTLSKPKKKEEGLNTTLKAQKFSGKFNASKHFGKIALKQKPLDIQKKLRNEWD